MARLSGIGMGMLAVAMGGMVMPMQCLAMLAWLLREVLDHELLRPALRKAEHGSSHRAPDGEHDHQQQQQPDAQSFHSVSLSQSSSAISAGVTHQLAPA